jgi:uncharacterized DUF497 family protein
MEIEFDPAKSERNQRERGLSFDRVLLADWSLAWVGRDERQDYGETRLMAYVPIAGKLHAVVYVDRGTRRRIISLRKANPRERIRYEKATQNQ